MRGWKSTLIGKESRASVVVVVVVGFRGARDGRCRGGGGNGIGVESSATSHGKTVVVDLINMVVVVVVVVDTSDWR
jgi:hypothetical protein